MELEILENRLKAAADIKSLWLKTYLDVYRYVTPNRDDRNIYANYTADVKSRTQDIYDSTAMLAADQRSNDLQGLIIPESRQWASYKVVQGDSLSPQISDNDVSELNIKINDFIQQSDLQIAAAGSFLDLTIGMGALRIESISDDQPLSFKSISSLSLYPEFTTNNIIDTAWIKYAMTGRQILEEYPKYTGSQRSALEESPDTVNFLWIGEIKVKNKYMTYGVLDKDKLSHLFPPEEKTYKRLIIFRDRVRPGEVQGRGVAMDLLPTIKEVNDLSKAYIKSMEYRANPMLFYDPGSKFNPYSFKQLGGIFVPRQPGQGNPIEPMQMPEYPSVIEERRDLRDVIRVGFKIDILGEIQSPHMTATEVGIRENKAQRTSATNIARLISEMPKQVFKSCTAILNERSLLGSKININDKRLRFNYSSPLLDIQKQQNLNALEGATQFIQQNYGEQAVLATFDIEKLIPFVYTNYNLPPNLWNDGSVIKNAVISVAKAAQQQAPQATTSATQQQPVAAPETLV